MERVFTYPYLSFTNDAAFGRIRNIDIGFHARSVLIDNPTGTGFTLVCGNRYVVQPYTVGIIISLPTPQRYFSIEYRTGVSSYWSLSSPIFDAVRLIFTDEERAASPGDSRFFVVKNATDDFYLSISHIGMNTYFPGSWVTFRANSAGTYRFGDNYEFYLCYITESDGFDGMTFIVSASYPATYGLKIGRLSGGMPPVQYPIAQWGRVAFFPYVSGGIDSGGEFYYVELDHVSPLPCDYRIDLAAGFVPQLYPHEPAIPSRIQGVASAVPCDVVSATGTSGNLTLRLRSTVGDCGTVLVTFGAASASSFSLTLRGSDSNDVSIRYSGRTITSPRLYYYFGRRTETVVWDKTISLQFSTSTSSTYSFLLFPGILELPPSL